MPEEVVVACLRRIGHWLVTFSHMMIFKIGISGTPFDRYHSPEIGYATDRVWQAMDMGSEILILSPARAT